MHPTAQRLHLAANHFFGKPEVRTSEIAQQLGVSVQTVTNWYTRGVSREGALLAEQHLKASSMQILRGTEYFPPFSASPTNKLEEEITPYDWPFRIIKKSQLRSLTLAEIEQLESVILQFLTKKHAPAQLESPS